MSLGDDEALVAPSADLTDEAPPAWHVPAEPLLEGRHRTLFEVLIAKEDSLAKMYVGALMARDATTNPDYLSQAGNSVRELIDTLPEFFTVTQRPPGRLNDKVNVLRDRWRNERRVRNGDDSPLSPRFLRELDAFFEWNDRSFPGRKEFARSTIRELDASGRRLPGSIENLRAEQWMMIRDFFTSSTHHASCSQDEFDQWLEFFEGFVLDLVRPRTFENADRIDELVRRIESDG
jgi:hypothetical protein